MQAKIVADSISHLGSRITTFELEFPRYILPQVLTYRTFSRSTRSSRAISTKKAISLARTSPVMPVFWGRSQAGMQSYKELSPIKKTVAKGVWAAGREAAILQAKVFAALPLTKQIANRVLEPYSNTVMCLTSTEWDNFFKQRCAADAQHEIQDLANLIKKALEESTPHHTLQHLPYVTLQDLHLHGLTQCVYLSAARCARVSYDNLGKKKTVEEDVETAKGLLEHLHLSPWEHIAYASTDVFHANFRGWENARTLWERTGSVV